MQILKEQPEEIIKKEKTYDIRLTESEVRLIGDYLGTYYVNNLYKKRKEMANDTSRCFTEKRYEAYFSLVKLRELYDCEYPT